MSPPGACVGLDCSQGIALWNLRLCRRSEREVGYVIVCLILQVYAAGDVRFNVRWRAPCLARRGDELRT